MIHCLNCGTANPQGSRLCDECGAALPTTGTRCPTCGTLNGVGRVYCQACNTSLAPMSGEHNGEEAGRDEAQDAERKDPPAQDWLDELRGSATEETADIQRDRGADGSEEPMPPPEVARRLSDSGAPDDYTGVPTGEEGPPSEDSSADREDVEGRALLDEQRDDSISSKEQVPPTAGSEGGGADGEITSLPEEETLAPARDIPEWLREMEPSAAPGAASDRQSRGDEEEQAIIQIPEWLKEAQAAGPARPPAELDEEPGAHPRVEPQVELGAEPEPEPEGTPEAEREAEPRAKDEVESEAEPDLPPEPEPETGPAPALGPETEEESRTRRDIEADLGEELPPPKDRIDLEAWQEAAASTRLSPESVKLPDWVTEAGGWAEEEPTAEETQPAESDEQTDSEVEREEPVPTEPPRESVGLPDWAQGDEGRPEESLPEQEESPFATASPETTDVPSWLSDLLAPSPAEAGEATPLPPERDRAEEERDSDLEHAEIPEWLLGLRPGQDEKRAVVRGRVETEGLLRGLRGVVPATSLVEVPAGFDALPPSGPSEASLARAELLQSIPGPAAATPRHETQDEAKETAGLVARWLVAGVLILTVLSRLVVLGATDQTPRLTKPSTSSSAVNLHRAVNELAAGDQVLVAFDYGPPEVDELGPAAQPVLEHIIDRGATLSIVSTRPDGLVVAEGLMSSMTDAEEQYTIVGYRPGAASGVSQLLAASGTSPELLLILTGRAMPLRLWVEQARALHGERLPLAAVGSAALEPVASAYLDANAGQMAGAVHGLRGAASYETVRDVAGAATRRLDALAAGHMAIVGLITIGAVVHAVGGAKRE